MNLKLMSFNTQHCLNYISKKIDFSAVADVIKEYGSDIVGLNEMRGAGEHPEYTAQTETLAESLGFYYYFAKAIDAYGKNNPYGNALLSRYPIISAETILIPDPSPRRFSNGYYETRCVLKAKIDTPSGVITVLVTHFGLNEDEAENAVSTVVESLERENCVLMGDFNLRPESPILLPIRERLFDTAELFTEELGSFPSDTPDRKIDYMFTSRELKVLSADIPPVVVSDHRPYIAEIEL